MKFFRAVVLFALGILLGSAAAIMSAMSPEAIHARASKQIVKLHWQGRGGTGFAIKAPSGKVILISNKHVCNLAEHKHLLLERDEKIYNTIVLEKSETTDLCAVDALDLFTGLNLAKEVDTTRGVHVLGHPGGMSLKHTFGFITGHEVLAVPYPDGMKDIDSFTSTALVAPGSSGSPVVDSYSDVVAVVYALDPDQSLLIPYKDLKEFLGGF